MQDNTQTKERHANSAPPLRRVLRFETKLISKPNDLIFLTGKEHNNKRQTHLDEAQFVDTDVVREAENITSA